MVFGRQKSSTLHRGFFGHRSSSDVSDLSVAANQRGARPISRTFSAAPTIAEDGCEVVPQFFPGYHINSPSTVQRSLTTKTNGQHYPGRQQSQRRVGCIKLATPPSDSAAAANPAAEQTMLDPRRFSGASFASTSTTSTLNTPNMPPQQPQMNAHSSALPQPARSHSAAATIIVAEADAPGTYSYRRRGSSLSIHRTPTIVSSATLSSSTPCQQQLRHPQLQQSGVSHLAVQPHRRSATVLQQQPRAGSPEHRLQRNNTTKTVSRNDLAPEPAAAVAASAVAPSNSYGGYRRLNSSRSANFHGTTRRNGTYYSTASPALAATYGPSACYGVLPKHSPTTRSPLAYEYNDSDCYDDRAYRCGSQVRDEGIDVSMSGVMAHSDNTGLTGCLESSCQDCAQSPAGILPLVLSSPPCVPPKALYGAADPQSRVPVLPTPPADGCNYVLTPVGDDSASLCGSVGYVEDEDIANKLVPRIDSCSPQLAYLPPRSSNLAVIN